MKIASFFAGVGGIDLAFKNAGFNTIWANEIDKYASETFKKNFKAKLVISDIRTIESSLIPDIDIIVGGFPCQPFSLAGHRKGFNDERSNVFFELKRIIKEKKPKIIFLENVKNLVGHDKGNTFKIILDSLKNLGYKVKYKVLNATEFGNIPQNRERIYIVAFLDHTRANFFEFPDPIILKTKLKNFIDFNSKKDEKYYYVKDRCKFYDILKETINKKNTVYQWRRIYVRENKSMVCPTLTANMGTGGHNVPLIYSKYGIRKLTPKECFLLQGFDKNFVLPDNLSNTRLYKQAGNSVAIPVVQRIAEEIKKVYSVL